VLSKSERNLVLILLCVWLTLFFFHLGSRPLWNIDEGKHAVTSKEMVLSGDWITPTLYGENFYDKPILFNWLAALSFLVFGFTEFAARFPAAILGLGCVVVTYLLGRSMFGLTTGFLGGIILTTSGMFIALSRSVVHDIALVFIVLVAPLINPYRSSKALAQRMDTMAPRGQIIVFFAESENLLCSIPVARWSACAMLHN